jgi:hypothetical protein
LHHLLDGSVEVDLTLEGTCEGDHLLIEGESSFGFFEGPRAEARLSSMGSRVPYRVG